METAGLEPASSESAHKLSTCLVRYLDLNWRVGQQTYLCLQSSPESQKGIQAAFPSQPKRVMIPVTRALLGEERVRSRPGRARGRQRIKAF